MSTPPTVPFSANPGEPTLADVLALTKKELLLSLNAHHLGTIRSFNSELQTAQATVNYQQTHFVRASSGQYVPKLVPYPVLMDCPVICLGGGLGALTFPIAAGDECLVLFNDRDINNWFQGNANTGPQTSRLHSFSDGLILVGLRSLANVLVDYDGVRIALRSKAGETVVGVNPATQKVLVTNTAPGNATTLNTLLAQLISNVQSLVTATAAITVAVTSAPGTSSVPLNAATISAVNSALTSTAAAIADLLE